MKKVKVQNKLQNMSKFYLQISNRMKRVYLPTKTMINPLNKMGLQNRPKNFLLLQQPTVFKILQL